MTLDRYSQLVGVHATTVVGDFYQLRPTLSHLNLDAPSASI
jgi:hypothetical protein